jgi:sulfotransferase
MEKLFHQSSLPRAGSTLLQNILAQNPNIYATPTSGVLELVFAARGNYTDSPEFKAQDADLMRKGFLAFCTQGMKAYYEAITDRKYVIDKSRGWGIHYDFLNLLNPEPKIICMVRDLRDIFASMEKNYRKNPDKQDPILNWAQMQGEVFRMGIDSKMLFVKFEDLCLYPEQQMNRIYAYLDIPFYKHDFDNIEQVTKEDDEVYGAFGDHTIRTKLEPVPSKAKTLLGKDVTDWIYNTYKWYFDQFGYKK